MKRLLWLVPPAESWLASDLTPRLETGLRSAGFIIRAPLPPRDHGRFRLLVHYVQLLRNGGDIVHVFDKLSALAALGFRRKKQMVVSDGGIASRNRGDWLIAGRKPIRWGPGGELPWPVVHEAVRPICKGDIIGLDLGKNDDKVAESAIWAFEIGRQVMPGLRLALGQGIHRPRLGRFANAVGASGAIGDCSCESALGSHRLRALLLAHPSRRLIDLAARTLASGGRVAWVKDPNGPVGDLPSTDGPVDWRDRPGLARLFLDWGAASAGRENQDGRFTDCDEFVRRLAKVYLDATQ